VSDVLALPHLRQLNNSVGTPERHHSTPNILAASSSTHDHGHWDDHHATPRASSSHRHVPVSLAQTAPTTPRHGAVEHLKVPPPAAIPDGTVKKKTSGLGLGRSRFPAGKDEHVQTPAHDEENIKRSDSKKAGILAAIFPKRCKSVLCSDQGVCCESAPKLMSCRRISVKSQLRAASDWSRLQPSRRLRRRSHPRPRSMRTFTVAPRGQARRPSCRSSRRRQPERRCIHRSVLQ
jgi:hypothetical protein